MDVVVSHPHDTSGRREPKLCICGVKPRRRSGVAGNTPLFGNEITDLPDLSMYRLKAGRLRFKPPADFDYGDASTAETISFEDLHGINRS
jgi:hypothetical protein